MYACSIEAIRLCGAAYRELFRTNLGEATLKIIRESLNQEVVLGNDRFREYIEKALARRARPGRRGRPSKQSQKPSRGFE